MATTYVVFRALPVEEGSPDKATFELVDQLSARSKDHAEKLYADKLPDADFDQGVTLAAVPVRSWKPESYGASTKRVIGKRASS